MRITKNQLRKIIREAVQGEPEGSIDSSRLMNNRLSLIQSKYDVVDRETSYPYGRYRGDVKSSWTLVPVDGGMVDPEDFEIIKSIEKHNHPLGGVYKHTMAGDGMSIYVSYRKHTAG
jgi:hypothetical protein